MSGSFDGHTVLITGAAGGFGRSVAPMYLERGANLVLSDFNADGLAAMAAGLPSDRVATLAGSVGDEAHCRATVDLALDRFGRLDVALNNAGIGHRPAPTHQIDSAQALATVQIDLMGVFYGMKAQLPPMLDAFEKEGRTSSILNVASLAGIGGAPTIAMYAAAKHGVVGLTKSAAIEYARKGVRVNCICPSFARTPMVEDGILQGSKEKEAEDHLTRGIPMRRLAEPEEITRSMLWMTDPTNTFMTGQAVALDGGTSAM